MCNYISNSIIIAGYMCRHWFIDWVIIFSYVASYWLNTLHTAIHQNLSKIQDELWMQPMLTIAGYLCTFMALPLVSMGNNNVIIDAISETIMNTLRVPVVV